MQILFATSRRLPRPDLDTPLLIAALARRGVATAAAVWNEPANWAAADLVVVRSTWDYADHADAFLAWTRSVAIATRLRNDADLIRWNAHKSYLAELSAAGIPVPATRFVNAGDQLGLTAADAGQDGRAVVKPAVGGGARGASVGDPASPTFAEAALAALGGRDALVQPFLPDIFAGERSLLFAAGAFTHAVAKLPAAGEWRVQGHYGGTVAPHDASAAERAVALAALQASPGGEPLVARVDLVGPAEAPLLMELEVIEPELFLPTSATAVEAFADAMAAQACG